MICHQALVSMASRLHIEGVHGTSASTLASLVLINWFPSILRCSSLQRHRPDSALPLMTATIDV
jgi:hypothetical protein